MLLKLTHSSKPSGEFIKQRFLGLALRGALSLGLGLDQVSAFLKVPRISDTVGPNIILQEFMYKLLLKSSGPLCFAY